MSESPKVLIVMGSDSDLPVMEEAKKALDGLGIPNRITVASAHRSPQRAMKLAGDADKEGIGIIIAGGGRRCASGRSHRRAHGVAGHRSAHRFVAATRLGRLARDGPDASGGARGHDGGRKKRSEKRGSFGRTDFGAPVPGIEKTAHRGPRGPGSGRRGKGPGGRTEIRRVTVNRSAVRTIPFWLTYESYTER